MNKRNALALLALVLTGCGMPPQVDCPAMPEVIETICRCDRAIAKTASGYIIDRSVTVTNFCHKTAVMNDGVYHRKVDVFVNGVSTNEQRDCYFTVSNNGADISEERPTQ